HARRRHGVGALARHRRTRGLSRQRRRSGADGARGPRRRRRLTLRRRLAVPAIGSRRRSPVGRRPTVSRRSPPRLVRYEREGLSMTTVRLRSLLLGSTAFLSLLALTSPARAAALFSNDFETGTVCPWSDSAPHVACWSNPAGGDWNVPGNWRDGV